MNIIFGGTGFIGTALCRALRARDEEVTAFSRRGNGTVPDVQYRTFDLLRSSFNANELRAQDRVFILTGQKGQGFDASAELRAHEKLLMELGTSPARVILASTVLVYGTATDLVDERSPCQPIDAYEQFKLRCEQVAQREIRADRLSILRIATLYGPNKADGVVRAMMTATSATPFQRDGDGHTERDYLFLDDTIRAIVEIIDAPDPSGITNVCSGESLTLLHLMDACETALERPIPWVQGSFTASGPQQLRVSNERLCSVFGASAMTPLAVGLQRTAATYTRSVMEVAP